MRKPSPLGILLKTLADASTGIMLACELVEGTPEDHNKPWYAEYGHTTATTLRVTKPYHGQGRYLIADAWFGGYKCCYALMQVGLYSIMNVKNNHKRLPKDHIKSRLVERNDRVHMKVEVEGGYTIYASGHKDVQPMVLVHSTGTSLEGEKRRRFYRWWDSELKQKRTNKYILD